jgi:archaellum biogenesis ATPase FlaH
VILTVHSNILDEKSLIRLRALCDADLNLTVENIGIRLVKVLEVRKLHGAELNTDNVFNFEVVPDMGIRGMLTKTIKV